MQTRSSCSECRFKKCLLLGMSIESIRFGRHAKHPKLAATSTNSTSGEDTASTLLYTPSLSLQAQLVMLLDWIKPKVESFLLINKKFSNSNLDMVFFTKLVQQFYAKATLLIRSSADSQFAQSPCISISEAKLNLVFVLFCVMFDIQVTNMTELECGPMERELAQLLRLYERNSCGFESPLPVSLRCVCFIHLVHNFVQDNAVYAGAQAKPSDSLLQNRVFDLLRSELASVRAPYFSITHSAELFQWLSQLQNVLNKYL